MTGPMLGRLFHWLRDTARPPLCRLEWVDGKLCCRRGAPPPGWLAACADVARDHDLRRGRLDVIASHGHLVLRFSADVPETCHQRFRNVLGVHLAGLRPPRRGRGRG